MTRREILGSVRRYWEAFCRQQAVAWGFPTSWPQEGKTPSVATSSRPMSRFQAPPPSLGSVSNITTGERFDQVTVVDPVLKTARVLGPSVTNRPTVMFTQKRGALTALAAFQRPQIRPTFWHTNGVLRKYHLAFPYCVFVLGFFGEQLGKVYVYYATDEPNAGGARLYRSNLPNVFADDSVCLGHGAQLQAIWQRVARSEASARDDAAIGEFWSSGFTWGANLGLPLPQIAQVSSLENWTRCSRGDPETVLKLHWLPACTVGQAMERYLGIQDGRVINY